MLVSEARRLQWKLISANCYCKTSNNGIQTSLFFFFYRNIKAAGFHLIYFKFLAKPLLSVYWSCVCSYIFHFWAMSNLFIYFFIVKSVQNNFKTEDCRFIITTFWNFSSTDSGRAGEHVCIHTCPILSSERLED